MGEASPRMLAITKLSQQDFQILYSLNSDRSSV